MKTLRARQRLAQRSYRNRRQNALASAQTRAAKLEKALQSTLQSINDLQQFVARNSEGRVPADILLQLTKTAADISAAAKQAQYEETPKADYEKNSVDLDSQVELSSQRSISGAPTSKVSKVIYNMPDNLGSSRFVNRKTMDPHSLANRMLQACFERYRSCVAAGVSGDLGVLCLLIMSLQPSLDYNYLQIIMKPSNDAKKGYWSDIQLSEATNLVLPKAYRIIEGEYGARLPRNPPPNLQKLQFGRTRTILHTDLIEMQGEWLEACDVEEYLAERGIYVRAEDSSNVLELGLSPDEDQTRPALGLDEIPQRVSGTNYTGSPPSGDYTIFGLSNQAYRLIPSGTRSLEMASHQYNGLAGDLRASRGIRVSDTSSGSRVARRRVTIDLDKLVSTLAEHAICLGVGPGVRRTAVDLAIRESMVIH